MLSTSNATDRMILTLIGSVILHVIVVFSISFNVFSPPTNAPVNQLDITLVKQQTEQQPEEASYLAQVNNEGGGETEEKSPEPTADLPVPLAEAPTALTEPMPPVMEETVAVPEQPIAAEPVIEPLPEITEIPAEPEPEPEPEPVVETPAEVPAKPEPEPEKANQKVTTETAERQVESSETVTETHTEADAEIAPPEISGAALIARARSEIGSLQNSLENNSKALSETPKKRRISAATKEYSAAAYMRAWEMKVERIGNMNYPQEAKDKGINGSLMLSVDINPDGSVPPDGIVVSRSSGHKVLDDAAVRIVRLGAPYAAIPEDVLQGSDMLTIIRTWKFESSRGMSAR